MGGQRPGDYYYTFCYFCLNSAEATVLRIMRLNTMTFIIMAHNVIQPTDNLTTVSIMSLNVLAFIQYYHIQHFDILHNHTQRSDI